MQDETGGGCGQPGTRVQKGDHDRHVRPADREHEQDPEERGGADEQDQHPLLLRAGDKRHPEDEQGQQQDDVPDLLSRIDDWTAADQILQLPEGDHAAGKRDASDQS